MKTGKVRIGDKDYITCFSTRVLLALEDKYGDSTEAINQIMTNRKITDLFYLLQLMLDAGDRYAKLEGIENAGTLSFDELVDSVGVDDYETMFSAITAAVSAGTKASVEVEAPKKTKTSQPAK